MTPQRPEDRRRAAETINSLGAVVSLSDFEECAEVLIPYDDDGTVLRGTYRGMRLEGAEDMEVGHLLRDYPYVRRSVVLLRPWWRWWQGTRAVRLLALGPVGGAS